MSMKYITKQRLNLALLNAAEFIRGHVELGIDPEDVNEEDEEGLNEYASACEKAANMIEKLSKKYEITKIQQ